MAYRPFSFIALVDENGNPLTAGAAGNAVHSFEYAALVDANGTVQAPVARHPGYIAGRQYATMPTVPTTGSAVAAVDIVYFYPFQLFTPIVLKGFTARVATAGAGSSMKTAIWADSAVSHRPLGAPLAADNVGVDTSTTGEKAITIAETSLAPGWYWVGSKFTGTLPSMYSLSGTYMAWAGGYATNGFTLNGLGTASAYANAMPTVTEGLAFTSVTAGTPLINLQL